MKKALILLALLTIILCFTGCNNDGVPSGMKLASDTTLVDFTLYVPEGWIIDSMSQFSSAHVSDSDRTGISVKKTSAKTTNEWWTSYKNALGTSFKDLKIETENEDYTLATLNSKRFVFTASFNDESHYKYELITVEKGGCVYEIMIKYQGIMKDGAINYSDKNHKDSIKKILDNFKFNDTLSEGTDISYEAEDTPENMKCASNARIVDYYLFVPNSWIVEKTVGTVSSAYVSEADKTNVSVMQWNFKGDFATWWNEYLLQLYSTFDYSAIPLNDKGEAVSDENGNIVYLPSEIITVSKDVLDCKIDEKDAKKYTYSVKIEDTVYDFEVYAIINRASVYVMTFTFKNGCDMNAYQSDVDKIISNFRFS